jgi:SAM-dependent methyltransferase
VSEVHASAAAGFDRAARAYERGRPDFAPEVVAYLVDVLDARPGRTILDLGAGTGKLSRLLAPTGARVIAVEPVAGMREVLAEAAPGAEVIDATAESLPLAPGAAEAAVAAQAFHWFDAPRALTELARVLPAGAPLALVWNVRDEGEPWVAAITDLIEPYRGDTPSHRSMRWLEAFRDDPRWPSPERRSFTYAHETTREAAVDRVRSISFIATLPDDERASVEARLRELLPREDAFVFPYRTDVWVSRRRASAP